MLDEIQRAEASVAEVVGRRHCCLTGRGASAIYVALDALDRRGRVALPATLCPSPANVTLYAGCEPVFTDVTLPDATMDPASLAEVLDEGGVVAVVPVHLYGHSARIDEIGALAASAGAVVIEDAAQSLGGTLDGRAHGSIGDVSILSFGHTKILDIGGGGAVLTDDDALALRIRASAARLPPEPADSGVRSAQHRRVYYALRSMVDGDGRLEDLHLPLPSIYRDLYLHRAEPENATRIIGALATLDDVVAVRRRNAARYLELLRHRDITPTSTSVDVDAPWRFSFLVPGVLQPRLSDALRVEGVDVSNWYPPLYRWYESGKTQVAAGRAFPNADLVGAQVVNLWVEPGTDDERVDHVASRVLEHLGELRSGADQGRS